MDRAAELDAIKDFLAARGAVRCRPAFAAPVLAALPPAEEVRRLAQLSLRKAATQEEIRRSLWKLALSGLAVR